MSALFDMKVKSQHVSMSPFQATQKEYSVNSVQISAHFNLVNVIQITITLKTNIIIITLHRCN